MQFILQVAETGRLFRWILNVRANRAVVVFRLLQWPRRTAVGAAERDAGQYRAVRRTRVAQNGIVDVDPDLVVLARADHEQRSGKRRVGGHSQVFVDVRRLVARVFYRQEERAVRFLAPGCAADLFVCAGLVDDDQPVRALRRVPVGQADGERALQAQQRLGRSRRIQSQAVPDQGAIDVRIAGPVLRIDLTRSTGACEVFGACETLGGLRRISRRVDGAAERHEALDACLFSGRVDAVVKAHALADRSRVERRFQIQYLGQDFSAHVALVCPGDEEVDVVGCIRQRRSITFPVAGPGSVGRKDLAEFGRRHGDVIADERFRTGVVGLDVAEECLAFDGRDADLSGFRLRGKAILRYALGIGNGRSPFNVVPHDARGVDVEFPIDDGATADEFGVVGNELVPVESVRIARPGQVRKNFPPRVVPGHLHLAAGAEGRGHELQSLCRRDAVVERLRVTPAEVAARFRIAHHDPRTTGLTGQGLVKTAIGIEQVEALAVIGDPRKVVGAESDVVARCEAGHVEAAQRQFFRLRPFLAAIIG